MSDVSVAPEQDQIAESLMGDPAETQVAEGAEQQPEVQEDQLDASQQQAEPEQEENAEDWLPTEQDRVFPDEVLLRYAQRYNRDEQWLSDPLNRQLIVDKINSDIYLRQQAQQEEYQEEPEAEVEQEVQRPQMTREQYFSNLDRMIAERTDPEVAKEFHSGFLRAFGVPEAEIAKMPPQQAQQFTQLMSRFGLNLVNTFMGDMLQGQLTNQINQVFPGFQEMHERSTYAMAWDRVRNSDPTYANLPAYGTKEFSAALRQAAARIPGFDEMQFTDRNGQPLPLMENSAKKYAMLAQVATGQHVDPALLQKAAAAGAKNARRADVRRSAGNLGSGQSKAASGTTRSNSKFQTNTDLFDDQTMDIYQREHGRL